MNKQRAGGRKDGYARTPGLTGIFFIHIYNKRSYPHIY